MSIEMENVIVVWMSAEMAAKLIDCRGTENIYSYGRAMAVYEFDKRPGDRPVSYIL